MARRGIMCRSHQILWDSPAASADHPFTLTVASSGTATIVSGGNLRLHAAANSASAGGVIASLPWKLTRLKSLEFDFKLEDLEAVAVAVLGIGDSFNASQDSVTNSCWAKIANTTLTLECDDNTTDSAFSTGLTLSASEWYRLRFNFWEQRKTQEPPSVSQGYCASVFFQNSTGFSRRVNINGHLNLYAIRSTAIAPFILMKASSTITGDGPKLDINAIRYELCDVN